MKMKIVNSKKLVFYIFIILISLIVVGLVGAIIRLINIPAILITLIIISSLSYYKRILPDSKSDFIFAILIEEYGLIGGIIVIILYLIFYQRVLLLSVNSSEKFPRLLLLGLGTIIVLQALLHMSVSVNLIPVTGQTLPLISKGGSSLWVTSLAFGIVLNISYQINLEDKI